MASRKYIDYRIVRASGEVQRWKLPRWINPQAVRAHNANSMLFAWLPKGSTVLGKNAEISGPAAIFWAKDRHWVPVTKLPETDIDAANLTQGVE